MNKVLRLKIDSIKFRLHQNHSEIRRLKNRLDKIIQTTNEIRRTSQKQYHIFIPVNGTKEKIVLTLIPSHAYSKITILFKPSSWRRSDISEIIKRLSLVLGYSYFKRFIVQAELEEIKIHSDLSPAIIVSDLVVTYRRNTYSNDDGKFRSFAIPELKVKLSTRAVQVNNKGSLVFNDEDTATRLELSLRAYKSKSVLKLKDAHKAFNSIQIEYVRGLANILGSKDIKTGAKFGIISTILADDKKQTIYKNLQVAKKEVRWPINFRQLWKDLIKPINLLTSHTSGQG